MAPPRIRCPACGRLALVHSLESAGNHWLELRRVLRGRGRARGFDWSREAVPGKILLLLRDGLGRALMQVDRTLAMVDAGAYPAMADIPSGPPSCAGCRGGLN